MALPLLRFGFFGDSIMAHQEGYAPGIFDGDALAPIGSQVTVEAWRKRGWVNNLRLGLQASWPAIRFEFNNHAVNGSTSRTLLPIIEQALSAPEARYDCLFYACGVNDVWNGQDGVSLDEYRRNYLAGLDLLQGKARVVVCLGSTPFALPEAVEMNARLVRYNAAAHTIVQAKGALWIDPFETINDFAFEATMRGDKVGPFSDGVHLNELGDTLMARFIEAGLRAAHVIEGLKQAISS